MSDRTEIKKTIVKRECVISKKCDVCGKDIPPLPRTFPQIYTPYYRITTYHNDWGNDSCESYDYQDACSPECALKICEQYIPYDFKGINSRTIKIEHNSCWVLPEVEE